MSNLDIYERAKAEGRFIVERKSTIRQAAKAFNVSKTTLHKDVTIVLERNNDPLSGTVRDVLTENFNEKHLRGGEATKQKYLKKKYI